MNQTGYIDVAPFSKGLTFNGGFCKWWYTPWQNVIVWPDVDSSTQYLASEPTLANGATWLGPIKVPDDELGFKEVPQTDAAGTFFKQSVTGVYPGDSGSSRINIENMMYNRFAVVGKMRAGGMFLLLGNEDCGLIFNHSYDSDKGANGSAGSDFSFGYDSIFKAAVLKEFLGINVTPPPDGAAGGISTNNGVTANRTQIIPFTNVAQVTFSWTSAEKASFGVYPTIEVWIDDTATTGQRSLANVPILVDDFPPATNLFTINLTGNASGIVVIK